MVVAMVVSFAPLAVLWHTGQDGAAGPDVTGKPAADR
jgi:hypothetical protein